MYQPPRDRAVIWSKAFVEINKSLVFLRVVRPTVCHREHFALLRRCSAAENIRSQFGRFCAGCCDCLPDSFQQRFFQPRLAHRLPCFVLICFRWFHLDAFRFVFADRPFHAAFPPHLGGSNMSASTASMLEDAPGAMTRLPAPVTSLKMLPDLVVGFCRLWHGTNQQPSSQSTFLSKRFP